MSMVAIKKKFNKHSRFWISFIIFVLVFVLLGLPFTNWGFMNDDFGLIFHSKIKDLNDILKFFIEGDAGAFLHPSNYVPHEKSFFSVYYRPMAFVFHAIGTAIWGFNPYGHYLFFIFFHAINSVLVFNFLNLFFEIGLAWWGAMFFAFHPSLCSWLGWISGLQQVMNFTFAILIAILFKHFLDSKNKIFYFCSLFLFLIALFTRETLVFFPIIIFLWTFVCSTGYGTVIENFLKSSLITSGFLLVDAFYWLFRIYHFPLKSGSLSESFLFKFFMQLNSRFFDLVTFLSDLAGLSFLPNGHRLLKGFLIIVIFSFLIYLFIQCKEKRLILFLIMISTILIWPAIFRYYSSRYLYKILPLIAFIFLIFIKNLSLRFKRIMLFAWALIVFNMVFLFIIMKENEKLYHKIHLALDELCMDARVQNRALCFVGVPYGFFPTGLTQAVLMRGVGANYPIYYERATFGFSHLPVYENCMKVIKTDEGFKLITFNREKLDLCCGGIGIGSEIGKFINIYENGNYLEKEFVFYKNYADQNLLLITWDYEKLKFVII